MKLRFEVIPYISPPLVSEQNIGVILNSRELGRWRFVEQQIKGAFRHRTGKRSRGK